MACLTYIGHSAFWADLDEICLLFDYTGGPLPDAGGRPIVTLTSHWHADHYVADALAGVEAAGRAFGKGVRKTLPGIYMKPGDEALVAGARVRAFRSTDVGVSFLAEAGGKSVFHAGDLNLWHWRAESSEREVREAEAAFERAIEPMAGMRPDAAMFPVDPRMGEGCAEGALRFCERARPKLILPMHFWDKPEAAEEFARMPMPEGVRAAALTRPGESIAI